jgi:hypothetical protein
MQFIAARFVEETMLMPISLFRMPATGTPLAGGVSRVNSDDFHAEGFRLIADKLLQLVKGPAVQVSTLRYLPEI